MMNRPFVLLDNENGSVLASVVLILIILTLIGFAATKTSTIEIQISGNEKFTKTAFHEADGGTEAAISLIEENISCPAGFADPPGIGLYHPTCINSSDDIILGQVIVPDGSEAFYMNEAADYTRPSPNPGQRDSYFYYPGDIAAPPPTVTQPHVNQTYNGIVRLGEGVGAGQIMGYESLGRGSAKGGERIYDLPAQRIGLGDCETCVRVQWIHKIGLEGTCSYQ